MRSGSHVLATSTDAEARIDAHANADERVIPLAEDIPWPEIVRLVRGTVRRILGPSRELDDLTQIALERVVRGLEGFEGRAELSTFVYRIAVNVALNHWRSWRRWLRRFDPNADASGDDWASEDEDGPYAAHAVRERSRHLRRVLDKLDADQRIALILADFEELPGPRIADILGCPEATVRSRLRLGRAKLAKLIFEEPFFREEIAP
jgi:RNA polymerase sigma-70 factor, ECF subfamily